jgi:hypothetical protein
MAPAQHAPAPAPAKKGKGKKAADPTEQQKQIQAKIAQLEQDAAGDKEQELEIGASTPTSEACGKWGCCGCSAAQEQAHYKARAGCFDDCSRSKRTERQSPAPSSCPVLAHVEWLVAAQADAAHDIPTFVFHS